MTPASRDEQSRPQRRSLAGAGAVFAADGTTPVGSAVAFIRAALAAKNDAPEQPARGGRAAAAAESSSQPAAARAEAIPAAAPLAGLDPGRSKCGLVLTDPERRCIREALVLPPEQAWERLRHWRQQEVLDAVVLGDGTGSAAWLQRLSPLLPVWLVDERGSTLAARQRYWQLEPPRGWRRLLPTGLRQPPRDWDDVVAQLLLERWLGYPLQRPAPAASLRSWRAR